MEKNSQIKPKDTERIQDSDSAFILNGTQHATHCVTKSDIPKTHISNLSIASKQKKNAYRSLSAEFVPEAKAEEEASLYLSNCRFDFSNFDYPERTRDDKRVDISTFSRISEIVTPMNEFLKSTQPRMENHAINFNFKIALLGDYGTGKSTLFNSFAYGDRQSLFSLQNFTEKQSTKKIMLDGSIGVTLNIFDTSGEEKYGSPTNQFFRDADGIFLCYDITNSKSFVSLSRWINLIYSNTSKPEVVIVLLGTKNDLEECREISFEDSSCFAKSNKIDLIEVSTITQKNIDLAFEFVSKCMILALEDEKSKLLAHHPTARTKRETDLKNSQIFEEKIKGESQINQSESLFAKNKVNSFKERASVIAARRSLKEQNGANDSIILTKDNISRRSRRKQEEKSKCC